MNQWKPYLIALAVGLLVGIERENSRAYQKALGVRTFLLISLLGALSGGLQSPLQSALITGFIFAMIFASYSLQKHTKNQVIHLGLTTEFAAGIVYLAGYLTHDFPILAATIGPLLAIILFSKTTLHNFTHSIKSNELKAAIMILLIAAVVIDLTPDVAIDPWGFFNPRKYGYLVLILATLEFLSYILYKLIGEKKSSLAVGFLGGIVSSTVVLISSAQQAKKKDAPWHSLAITSIAAQISSMIELLLIVSLVSPALFVQVAYCVLPLILFGVISVLLLNRNRIEHLSKIELRSPLDWKGVFRLSVIFTFVLALISVTEHWLGKKATLALSFITGLFELQGISIANATLFVQNQVSLHTSTQYIAVAIAASLCSKIAISIFFGRNKFSFFIFIALAPMIGILLFISNWIMK